MKGSKLYVGNLSYNVTSEELREAFTAYGAVESVNVIEGKGFAFVEMSTQAEAENAKKELDGSVVKGRNIKVNAAQPPKSKRGGRGGRRY
jgi:RNA recognition motif-containing protein